MYLTDHALEREIIAVPVRDTRPLNVKVNRVCS